MKPLLCKIPAMIAMLISLFSFGVYVQSLVNGISDVWILSVIIAVLSMLFYVIDAIISLVKAVKKDDSKFNYILALVLIGAIPMLLFFGQAGIDFFNVIWNVYYLMMFALEVISVKKAIVTMKAKRAKAAESAGNA